MSRFGPKSGWYLWTCPCTKIISRFEGMESVVGGYSMEEAKVYDKSVVKWIGAIQSTDQDPTFKKLIGLW